MTRKQLEAIVTEWQKKLGLERYVILIQWDVLPEGSDGFYDGAQADIRAHKTYDTARVRFGPDATLWDRDRAVKNIIHELLHVLHNPLDQAVDSICGDLPARSQADNWYESALETFIDRVALRLYEIDRADR